jgi:hypothetical protein
MLGNGYRENRKGKIPAIDCALFLAKIIHTDLVVANASAWQLWNVYEPGSPDYDTRYYLIALQTNEANSEGEFFVTKNLWAMGHYSRFIRPGMQRLIIERDDNMSDEQSSQDLMCSAFGDKKGNQVMVFVNYSDEFRTVSCNIPGPRSKKKMMIYTTTAGKDKNMLPAKVPDLNNIKIEPRSINTVVIL